MFGRILKRAKALFRMLPDIETRIDLEALIEHLGRIDFLHPVMAQRRRRRFGGIAGHEIATNTKQETVRGHDAFGRFVLCPAPVGDAKQEGPLQALRNSAIDLARSDRKSTRLTSSN